MTLIGFTDEEIARILSCIYDKLNENEETAEDQKNGLLITNDE